MLMIFDLKQESPAPCRDVYAEALQAQSAQDERVRAMPWLSKEYFVHR